MTTLILKDATYVANIPLFRDINLTLGRGDRIGLVAGNGAGKTTLLKCLAGEAELTSGNITRSRGARVGYVEQHVNASLTGRSFYGAVQDALPEAARESESWRVDVVLDTLGAPEDIRHLLVSELSGGWQRLMLLARVWVTDPDVLLLDEPTNHLDLEKILLLEDWVRTATAEVPVVIASHDRGFLDGVTNRTLFLRAQASRYFALPYSLARVALEQEDAADAVQRERELKEAQQLRRQSAKLKNIGINSGSDLLQKKQRQLRQRAEKIEDGVKTLHKERRGDMRLANRGTHAKVLVEIEGLIVRRPDGARLFEIPWLHVFQGDRIVLLGRNGAGKSTLIGMLRRVLEDGADVTGIRATPSLVTGYMDQALSNVPDNVSPFDFIAAFGPGDQRTRALLAAAGIAAEKQGRPIGGLSFGQRARLGILALRLKEPNFYLLDEPTNHIDIAGQETLAAEIAEHRANCVLVSHDRAFVRDVGTRFLVIDRGRLEDVDDPESFFASMK
ncbi:ABC-F family ATP-binding cassette domain-containing protein [Pelagibacterium xiamenense]|uniref:ABC-F family ATP-binding cassette domain-containing protein n=1 Tax=Pelagibacterium xiamenense TaxID=2901140 RepID=UPI001E2B8610|nr:ABC-F family ATP-binding cassette domain-containing protein [Pelagibacterium xiamenense]MCD7061089.1 ATP-binding cassette domain-containing protein [Pelagibacterium xiamenense]